MRVAVIGGGPSGLVTLKYLATAHNYFPIEPIQVVLFEAESSIGGTFKHRSYEDGEVLSTFHSIPNTRKLTHLCSWFHRSI